MDVLVFHYALTSRLANLIHSPYHNELSMSEWKKYCVKTGLEVKTGISLWLFMLSAHQNEVQCKI